MKPTPCYDELLRQYNAGERIQSSTIGGALVEIEELRLSYDSVAARIAAPDDIRYLLAEEVVK